MYNENGIDEPPIKKRLEQIRAEISMPSEDAPLNYNTIDDFFFFIQNQELHEGMSYSVWVQHTNGVEFPVIHSGMTIFNSSNNEVGKENRIYPSKTFSEQLFMTLHEKLLFPVENYRLDTRFPTQYKEKWSEAEKWVVINICQQIAMGDAKNIPYELLWIVDEVISRLEMDMRADEIEKDVVETMDLDTWVDDG